MAESGVCSRRKAEDLICQGRVAVNGKPVKSPGVEVDPARDLVTVNGVAVGWPSPKVHIALHKPSGYVSTTHDPQGRPTVLDLLKGGMRQEQAGAPGEDTLGDGRVRLFIAGRLDLDSEGLVILTNDGRLAQQITHPSYGTRKKYVITVKGVPGEEDLESLTKGLLAQGEFMRADSVAVLEVSRSGAETTLEVVIHEGKKREIKRIFREIGHPVKKLVRVAIGPVNLGGLPPGSWRRLTREELDEFEKAATLARRRRGSRRGGNNLNERRKKQEGPCGYRHAGGFRGGRGESLLRSERETDRAGDKVQHR